MIKEYSFFDEIESEIKNVVFDYNGVLAGLNKTRVLSRVNLKDICNAIGFGFSYLTKSGFRSDVKYAYHGLTNGSVSPEDIYHMFESYFPHKSDTVKKVFDNFVNSMYTREGMIRLVDYLRENQFRVFVLSNTIPETAKILNSDDVKKHFDGIYCTSEHGIQKPDIDTFLDACKIWNIKPEESLFVDDKKVNTKAAEAAGFGDTFNSSSERKIKNYINQVYLD